MTKIGITDHGITETTPDNILLGAGAVYKNFAYNTTGTRWEGDILGATSGGNKLAIVPEMIDLELDGASVPVEGISRVKSGETATLEVNLVELTPELISKSIVGKAVTAADATVGVVTADIIAGFDLTVTKPLVEAGDYYDNIAFVGKKTDGSPIIIIFPRALCTGGLTLEAKNKDKASFPVKFECVAPLTNDGKTYSKLPLKIYTKTPVSG
jgi:hypothetical protein